MVIAYDGSGYHGWQRQLGVLTIQEAMELGIARVVNHPVFLRASGRTDTGVHAAGQVGNFRTTSPIPAERLAHAINTRLPNDIRVLRSEEAPADFDAITWARGKLYRYTLFNHPDLPCNMEKYCYHWWRRCQVEPMRAAAAALLGEHDFASFASTGHQKENTVRTLSRCDVWREYHWVHFELEASGFLYNMVRNIVGTLLEVGRGHWPAERVGEILAARARTAAGPKVPSNGLSLRWVRY